MVKLYAALWLLAAATAYTEAWKCREDGYAYYGNNIPGQPSYQPSESACQQACAQHDGCSYWSFGSASEACYLKTSSAGKEPAANYVSGTKDCNDKGDHSTSGINSQ